MSTAWSKEDTIALFIKWAHTLFIAFFISLFFILVFPEKMLLLIPVFIFVSLYLCLILLEFRVWKTWAKYVLTLAFIATPVGFIICLLAYSDALWACKGAGYHIGFFGPKEISLFGKKHL